MEETKKEITKEITKEALKDIDTLCKDKGIEEYVFAAAIKDNIVTRWSVTDNPILKGVIKLLATEMELKL